MPELDPSFQPQNIFEQHGEPRSAELGIVPVEPVEELGGFVHGAMNNPEAIAGLTELNGLPIEAIESNLRPDTRRNSEDMIGADESLIDVLAMHAEVVGRAGLAPGNRRRCRVRRQHGR